MFDFVRSFAHRGLTRTANYRDVIDGGGPRPGYANGLPLGPGEHLIGVYENVPGQRDECIAVTSHGLLLATPSGWRRVAYEQMIDYELPDKSTEQRSISVELRSNETLQLPVRGRVEGDHGEARDVYGMDTFLRGILWVLHHRA